MWEYLKYLTNLLVSELGIMCALGYGLFAYERWNTGRIIKRIEAHHTAELDRLTASMRLSMGVNEVLRHELAKSEDPS